MQSGIYKDAEKRKAYQHQYQVERWKKKKESREYLIRKCIRRVKGLRKEIGNYNTNVVIELLEEIAREEL